MKKFMNDVDSPFAMRFRFRAARQLGDCRRFLELRDGTEHLAHQEPI
jgi:hypothetical protein